MLDSGRCLSFNGVDRQWMLAVRGSWFRDAIAKGQTAGDGLLHVAYVLHLFFQLLRDLFYETGLRRILLHKVLYVVE